MGLIYASADSSQLITALKTNISSAKETTNQLKLGSQNVVEAVDGRILAGAAYTAGKGLFSELIIPTIARVTTAFDQLEQELNTYQSADNVIRGEGSYLDEEILKKKIEAKKAQKRAALASVSTLTNQIKLVKSPDMSSYIRSAQREMNRLADSLDDEIRQLEKKIEALHTFSSSTKGLFSNSLNELKIAMQGVLVLSHTVVNKDGSYTLPKGISLKWFNSIQPNAKEVLEKTSTSAFLELYKQVEDLLNPLKGGNKSDNIKRLEMLLKYYPAATVTRLLSNDEFWILANKLSPKGQTRLINGLVKFEEFGNSVSKMKWIPKINTIGKAFENFNKFTNPVKTFVSESLKNSSFVQGAKQWGVVKGIGKVATVATYAQLGVTFVSSGVNDYGKTGSIGKGVIGGTIDTIKSVGPLEGVTVGAAVGGPMGAVVGGVGGLINVGIQFWKPNLYGNIKTGAYNLYDKGKKTVGNVVNQGVNTIKGIGNNINNMGKSIGKTTSSIKVPKLNLGW